MDRKVTAGALAGSFTVVLVWIVRTWGEVEIPAEVASSITVIFTFATSFFVPNKQ